MIKHSYKLHVKCFILAVMMMMMIPLPGF